MYYKRKQRKRMGLLKRNCLSCGGQLETKLVGNDGTRNAKPLFSELQRELERGPDDVASIHCFLAKVISQISVEIHFPTISSPLTFEEQGKTACEATVVWLPCNCCAEYSCAVYICGCK